MAKKGTKPKFPVAPPDPPPPFRRLRTYAFDPSLATQLDTAGINEVTLNVRWENPPPPDAREDPERGMTKGPVGEYLEVIDYDPASDCYYAPVDLNDPGLLAQDGLPPSEGNPQFHQQMVYAVAMTTIKNFERALGRLALWAPRFVEVADGDWRSLFVRRLRIYPHALRQANAYYSPQKKALLFGYFPADASDPAGHMPGGTVFTCLSHDVVVHETTHALLDGIHRRYIEASNPDALAFHEAFADVCALFQHFSFPDVLRHQIGKTRGDLARQNILGELAQQFGRARGNRGALRSAIGREDPKTKQWEPHKPKAGEYRKTTKPHERGSHLVAAVFEAFVSIYKARVADLLRMATGGSGVLPEGQLQPDLLNRLSGEAAKASQHVLNMCIRALDYCPPIDPTFGEYLRALITADYDLVPNDKHSYRVAMVEAFRRRGIYPNDLRTLSEDTLRWHTPTPDEEKSITGLLPDPAEFRRLIPDWDMDSDRRRVFGEIQKVQGDFKVRLAKQLTGADEGVWKLLGLSKRAQRGKFEVHSMRPARRQGPDGQSIVELVVEVTQRVPIFFGADGPPGPDGKPMRLTDEEVWHRGKDYVALVERPKHIYDADVWFRGGATLLIDPRSARIRYVIGKGITNRRRLEQQARYAARFGSSLRATYFGAVQRLEESEAFAMLHGDRPEEGDDE